MEPAKLLRIASMVRELLDETRQATLDEAGPQAARRDLPPLGRASWASRSPRTCRRSSHELAPPLEGVPTESEIRIAQAQLVGWLEGLFHGIQAAMFAQQAAARQQFEELRRRGLPGGPEPAGGQARRPARSRRTAASTSSSPLGRLRALRRRGRASGPPASRCAMYTGIDRQQHHRDRHDVHHRPVPRLPQVVEDELRQRDLRARDEVRHDDLVERQREREQRPRDERRADRGERHVAGRSATRPPRGPSTPRPARSACGAAARSRCCRRRRCRTSRGR